MPTRAQTFRLLAVGLVGLFLGVLDSLIKGQSGGLLFALGQTAAPWLLLAFVAGAATGERRYLLGAIAGLGATVMGLIGFYFVNSLFFGLGVAQWPTGFHFALLSGKEYFELAVVSGPLLGAFGAWWRRNLSLAPVVTVGLLFLGEALARALQASGFFQHGDQVAVVEAVVGVAWMAVALRATVLLRQRDLAKVTPHDRVVITRS